MSKVHSSCQSMSFMVVLIDEQLPIKLIQPTSDRRSISTAIFNTIAVAASIELYITLIFKLLIAHVVGFILGRRLVFKFVSRSVE